MFIGTTMWNMSYQYTQIQVVYETINQFQNFNGSGADVWEWMNNFIPYFTRHVITYLCWY